MKPMTASAMAEGELCSQARRKADQTTDPLEKLRQQCLSQGPGGILQLSRVFRRMGDGSNSLNREEFSQGIQDAGMNLNQDQIEELFQVFETDDSGSINKDDFLTAIRPQMSDVRKKSVNDAFDRFDKTKDGVIKLDVLRRAYHMESNPRYQSGEESREEILKKFIGDFEKYCVDGEITREEFMDYYAAVSSGVDTDTYFDLVLRQAYH